MTTNALIYAWIVILVGVAVLACAALGWRSWTPDTSLACVALATLSATFKLKLPNLTGTLSPAFVFVLVAIATRSWSETVALAAVSGIVQCLWRPNKKPGFLQTAFNGATMAISGAAAHGLAWEVAGSRGPDMIIVALGAAGITLLVSNTLLIAMILCLIKEAPFQTAWRSFQVWAVPYYLAGGVLASVWARADLRIAQTIVLAALSAYILNAFYRAVTPQVIAPLITPQILKR